MGKISLFFNQKALPWSFDIFLFGRKYSIAKRPRGTMTLGSIILIWRLRYGLYASISSGRGSRFLGGLLFMMFVMYVSSLFQPISSISLSKSWPARPTKGLPARSSQKPGPSPIKRMSVSGSPSPKTRFDSKRGRVSSPAISFSSLSKSSCLLIYYILPQGAEGKETRNVYFTEATQGQALLTVMRGN